ncbi:hypothetical protein LOAG_13244 [Loa loa]|uniref:Uncharacterized protein n=2 Tax=Loa loa TaxID=7209 RepID=A0A1S0TK89_LOALO|nr:hypothetical protein LOAG_13244 [Loa loa]EFO15267.2 hypothetical protein LOAG_13244 [Loa loa]
MWFKTNVIVVIYFIIGLNAKEINANIEKHMEAGELNSKDLKTRRIVKQANAERMRQQYRRSSGDDADEQLKWLNANEMYNLGHIALLLNERDGFDETLISTPSKKAITSRLCGSKLVEAIIKLCHGCVKPIGGKAVSAKRCKLNLTSLNAIFAYFQYYLIIFSE